VIFKKGKASEGETSIVELGNPLSPSIETPFSSPQLPNRPFFEVSHFINFGSVPVEFSSPGLGPEGQNLVTPLSPETVPRRRPGNA
jgi:hypothetical protein